MSTEEVEEDLGHVEGPSWQIVGKFELFEEADTKRNEISENIDLQVKIHQMGTVAQRYFAVKQRPDPQIAIFEEDRLRKEEKKKRKARLNKKRRKK